VNDIPHDLLAAVDALTTPVTQVRWQDDGHDHEWEPVSEYRGEPIEGLWTCRWCDETTRTPTWSGGERVVRRRVDAPLLDQLRDAVASSLESGGGGKPGRERVPIDVAALTLYEDIDGRIRSWLDELGARPGRDVTPTQALRTWYVMWTAGRHTEGLEDRYQATIEGWAQQVRDKLQPPKRIEITAPCPVCGREWINVGLKLPNGDDDPNDVEMVRVLNAVERETIDDSYAMCQACNTVWVGTGRMRQLRIAIDDQAAV
jgi:hypothetical protein